MKVRPAGDFLRFDKSDIEQSIPERFEQQVRSHGERTAICEAGQSFSYAALNRASNQVARTILSRRGEHNEPVAVLLEHGIPAVLGRNWSACAACIRTAREEWQQNRALM